MPRTIFILGAGSSHPYGFPLGENLVNVIIEELKVSSFRGKEPILLPEKKLLKILLQEFEWEFVESFRKALIKSGTYSIDSFLTNREDFRQIGKMCISYILMNYEMTSMKGNSIFLKGDWYKLLWNNLNIYNNADNFSLSFYTFNYDRSLEFYLYTAYKNLHNASNEKIRQYFQNIPIIHLHGSLGNLNFLDSEDSVPYGNLLSISSYNRLQEISEQINVIYEATD